MEPLNKRQKLESRPHFQPLMCVQVVCRERPSILGIAHVAAALDAFLDWSPRCTVAKACALCSPRLLQRVLAQDALEPADSIKRDPRFRQWQFEHGMISAVASGNLEVVKALGTLFPHFSVSLEVVNGAVFHGRLEILKWLYANCPGIDSDYYPSVGLALRSGHFEVAKFLQTKLSLFNEKNGEMKKAYTTKWYSLYWANIAAESGSLEMVKWAYRQFSGPLDASESTSVVTSTVNGGHLDILKWLFENICGGRPGFSVHLGTAVYRGHLNVVEWMLRNQRAVCRSLCSADVNDAARYGRLDILRLLHAYKVDGRTTNAMDHAARNGHLDTIKWFHANNLSGCTWSAMDNASAGGYLDVVQWLHENRLEGCTWGAMGRAAAGGHMEVLQWLTANRREGCTSNAMNGAATNGHLDIVKWLHNNRTEGCTFQAMDGAAMKGHLAVVKWLHVYRTEGCTVGAMNHAAMNGHLEVVEWLHANRTEGCSIDAMDLAAEHGHLEVVKWLHANRTEGCSSSAGCDAIWGGKMEVALFLHCERENCNFASALGRWPGRKWEAVNWLYCHCSPDVASAMVAHLKSAHW